MNSTSIKRTSPEEAAFRLDRLGSLIQNLHCIRASDARIEKHFWAVIHIGNRALIHSLWRTASTKDLRSFLGFKS